MNKYSVQHNTINHN